MKHIASTTLGLVALAVLSTATVAQKPGVDVQAVKESTPGKAGAANIVTVTAAVEAIDEKNRVLTLKGTRGLFDLAVGPEVKNFAQIKVGDNLVVRYAQALTLELKKGGRPFARGPSTRAVRPRSRASGLRPPPRARSR